MGKLWPSFLYFRKVQLPVLEMRPIFENLNNKRCQSPRSNHQQIMKCMRMIPLPQNRGPPQLPCVIAGSSRPIIVLGENSSLFTTKFQWRMVRALMPYGDRRNNSPKRAQLSIVTQYFGPQSRHRLFTHVTYADLSTFKGTGKGGEITTRKRKKRGEK